MRLLVALILVAHGTAFALEPSCLGPEVGEAVSNLMKANGIPVPEGFSLEGITVLARSINVALRTMSGDRVLLTLEATGHGRCGKYFCWTAKPGGALDPDPIGTAIDGLFRENPFSRCGGAGDVVQGTGERDQTVPRPLALGLAALELAFLVMATVLALVRTGRE